MLYLDYAINNEKLLSEKQKNMPAFFQKFIIKFKKIFGLVLKYEVLGRNVVVLPKINKNTLKKLDKIFKIDVTRNVCVCDELLRNEQFVKYLENRKLNIINGKWLFKYMLEDIIQYICDKTKILPETQEISVLSLDNNTLISESIKKLSSKVKNINIITKDIKKFKKLEQEIYNENGLIINVTNNSKKGVLKSNIIINFDFSQENFDKIVFPKNAIIVNLNTPLKVNQKSFCGVYSDFFNINLPIKYKEMYRKLNGFNSVNLYESIILKNTAVKNIWNEIANDKIEILSLEGKCKTIKFDIAEKSIV